MKIDTSLTRVKREEIISSLLKNKGLILDAGCGKGRYIDYFNKNKIIAIDISKSSIKKIKLLNNKNYYLISDATCLPFKNNMFDFILFSEVIEHLDNPYKALVELERVLKVNGTMIISTPSANFPFIWDIENYLRKKLNKRVKKKLTIFTNWTPKHKKLFSCNELINYLNHSFKIERVIYSGHIFTPILTFIWYILHTFYLKINQFLKTRIVKMIFSKVFLMFLYISKYEDKLFKNEPCINIIIEVKKRRSIG